MKVRICCQQCFEAGLKADKEKHVPYVPTYPYWNYPLVQIDKWPHFEMKCPEGHIHRYMFSNELYELLFQQATYCIQDGYYRESIGTYHAALERYFEYCIEIFSYYNNSSTEFIELWKNISQQSERQLGAYYSLWLATMGENPVFLDNKKVQLRNEIVHKGELANENDAKEYGKYVFEYIRDSNSKLNSKLGEHLAECRLKRMIRKCKKDIEESEKNPIIISTENEQLYVGVGSLQIPSYLSDVTKYPNYSSCFQDTQINELGFVK